MVLREIVLCTLILFLLLTSCLDGGQGDNNQRPTMDRSVKDELLRQMTRDVFYQDSVMRVIHAELERIDVMYINYERGSERSGNRNNQANDIISRIRHLNNLLERASSEFNKSSLENRGLMEMIERFKRDLAVKEEKIRELQQTVSAQEEVIRQHEQKIDILEIANNRQKEEINRMDRELKVMKAAAFRELADLLVQISSEVPEVRGLFARRTREDVEQMQNGLIKDAYRYYNEASVFGDTYSRQRAEELERQYQFLR